MLRAPRWMSVSRRPLQPAPRPWDLLSRRPPAPSRIHVEDAAGRTMALLGAPSGIVVLTDEDDRVSDLAP